MIARGTLLLLALLLATTGCGRYGPPVRAAEALPALEETEAASAGTVLPTETLPGDEEFEEGEER